MLSKATITAYANGVDSISDSAAEYVAAVIGKAAARGASIAELREVAIEAIMGAGEEHNAMVRELACTLYERQTGQAASFTATFGIDRDAVDRYVRYHAGKLKEGRYEAFVSACTEQARWLARRGVNEEIIGNCRPGNKRKRSRRKYRKGARGVRFARVPRGGDTCTFCAMLASRGFVYWSRESAGEFSHYHRHCRCLVVPDDGSGEVDGYDPTEWAARWREYEEIDARGDLTGEQKTALKRAYSAGPALRTRADPALDYFGPAEDDDPEVLARIKEDLARSGVEIVVSPRDREAIGYGPSSTPGEPGNLHVTEGMSLSAWMHEYKHFCQDRDRGFPRLLDYLENKSLRASMEEEAYGVEIKRAADSGYNDLVDKLMELLGDERRRIENEGIN